MAYETFMSPILTVGSFPKIHEADQYPGDDSAYFKAPIVVTKGSKEFTALVTALTKIADLVGATKLKSGKYAPETLGLKVQKDEDGEPSNVYKYTPTSKKAPMLVDADGKPMGRSTAKGMPIIGEGSTIAMKLSCDKGTKGQVRSYLDAVQIATLKAFTGGDSGPADVSGFGSIAGGYVHTGNTEDDTDQGDGDAYGTEPEDDDGGLEI